MFAWFFKRSREIDAELDAIVDVSRVAPRQYKCGVCGELGHNSRRHQAPTVRQLQLEVAQLERALRDAEAEAAANRAEADSWRAEAAAAHAELSRLRTRLAMAVSGEGTR